jgi:hypothetical protein
MNSHTPVNKFLKLTRVLILNLQILSWNSDYYCISALLMLPHTHTHTHTHEVPIPQDCWGENGFCFHLLISTSLVLHLPQPKLTRLIFTASTRMKINWKSYQKYKTPRCVSSSPCYEYESRDAHTPSHYTFYYATTFMKPYTCIHRWSQPHFTEIPEVFLSCPCALTEHHIMKAYWGVDVWLHAFFDLGTRWRRVVSFMSRPLYPQGKSPCYPLDRRLGGPQSMSGRGGEEKNFQPVIIQPVA